MIDTSLVIHQNGKEIMEAFSQACIECQSTFGLPDKTLLKILTESEYVENNFLNCTYSDTEKPYSTKEQEKEAFIKDNRYYVHGDNAKRISEGEEDNLRREFDREGNYSTPKYAETIEQAAIMALQVCKGEKCSKETCEEYDLYNKLRLDDYDKNRSQIFRTQKYIIAI